MSEVENEVPAELQAPPEDAPQPAKDGQTYNQPPEPPPSAGGSLREGTLIQNKRKEADDAECLKLAEKIQKLFKDMDQSQRKRVIGMLKW